MDSRSEPDEEAISDGERLGICQISVQIHEREIFISEKPGLCTAQSVTILHAASRYENGISRGKNIVRKKSSER